MTDSSPASSSPSSPSSSASPFGIIEAYYGPPWPWAERHAMLDFMGDVGFDAYLYAPKNDPLHRNRWREPYTKLEWREFASLVGHANDVGVDFIFGLSAAPYRYSNPEHLDILRGRLHAAREIGVRSFSLLLDDLPSSLDSGDDVEKFGSLAHAQAWLVSQLLPDTPGTFYFTPTQYHGRGVSEYLTILGEHLHPAARVFWTGPKVVSDTIELSDLEDVTASLRRRVTIWDNFPVNDLDMRYHLHVEAITGRAPDLLGAVNGYFAAAGRLAAAHRVSLRTVPAAFLKTAPGAYDPDAALQSAAKNSTANEREAEALLFLADLARRSPPFRGTPLAHSLWPVLDAFWAARGADSVVLPDLPARPPRTAALPDEAPLRTLVRDMELHALTLARLSDRALRRDLTPWAEKLLGWSRVMKYALGALDHPHDARAREYVLEELPIVRENFAWVAGDTFDHFARACVFEAERLADLAPAPELA